MGRFGVGLPQASLHVCPRVEVYSWRDGNVNKVYLDINEIKSGIQQDVAIENNVELPAAYKKYISNHNFIDEVMDFSKSGTLVVWKKCDRLQPKTIAPLFERFKFLLGRKFRYFVHNRKA